MPLVIVQLKPRSNVEWVARATRKKVAEIVAQELSCNDPDGQLTWRDIDVKFREMEEYDLTSYSVEIYVFASEFTSRAANLDERRSRIVNRIAELLGRSPGVVGTTGKRKAFVYIRLAPSSFGEFEF